jgi:hypothetical protein
VPYKNCEGERPGSLLKGAKRTVPKVARGWDACGLYTYIMGLPSLG